MIRLSLTLIFCVALEWVAAPATARAQSSNVAGCHLSQQMQGITSTVLENGNHVVLEGTVDSPAQVDCDEAQFFADHVEYFKTEGRVLANGHVLYTSGGNRISSERMDFNTKTRTGVFYIANGTAVLRDKPDPSLFGGPEPDLMFRGDEIHKLGPKKYRIVRGGFSSCVQPTPRWEMTSGSITLTLEEHAVLINALFKVKSVPVMYLPALYYPIKKDDRATGFLIPIYGSSTIKGKSLGNRFFWAIGRSHDAMIYHDWFSKAGQQIGGDYRYILDPGSQGNARMSFMKQPEIPVTSASGQTSSISAEKSYRVDGGVSQQLPFRLHARGNASYFSSIRTNQLLQQDIRQSTNGTRNFGGNLSGNWNAYSLSVTADRSDYFSADTSFTTQGTRPRVTFSRGERPIAGAPIYFGVSTDFATIDRSTTTNDVKGQDQGLTKLDVSPGVRIPFTRWPFLSVNSYVSWHGTYWTESLVNGVQSPEPIGRRYFDLQSRIAGPVFNKIWNRPPGGYANKFKHVIEPSVSLQHVTAIDNGDRIVKLDGSDYTVGNLTKVTYGVTNRLYAKKETSRDILDATVSQSYYTNGKAAAVDRQYQSSGYTTVSKETHFSAVALQVRAAPTDRVQTDFRTEWDASVRALRTLAANGSVNAGWVQATVGWSQRRLIPALPDFANPASASHYLNVSTNARKAGSPFGGTYAFNYDLRRDTFLQQRFLAYYNAQCCGVAAEYQTYNLLGTVIGRSLPQDHRFNLSFTLAGIGTFSNLLGAFGGAQGR